LSNRMKGVFVLLGIVYAQFGASQEELDLFDLVEDVNANFYDFLGVEQTATTKEIKSKYRKLSLTWHPDKNSTEGATDNFRKLAQIVEVMKNEEMRERYNRVLVEGLPNWKSAAFYMRKMRKMSLLEISILLVSIATIIHYCTMWASYWEKKMILADQIDAVSKRKKQKDAVKHLEQAHSSLPYPSLGNLLPFLIVRGTLACIKAIPEAIKTARDLKAQEAARILAEKDAIENEKKEIAEEKLRREKSKKERLEKEKQRKAKEMERRAAQLKEIQELQARRKEEEEDDYDELEDLYGDSTKKRKNDGPRPWTEEDMLTLTRLLAKFPGGTSNRWDRIADEMDRPVSEITKKTKEAQKKMHQYTSGTNMYSSSTVVTQRKGKTEETSKDEKTEVDEWSQAQQKLLEIALKKIGKDEENRWDKIAETVEGKTKRQCMLRYKFIAQQLKTQKVQ